MCLALLLCVSAVFVMTAPALATNVIEQEENALVENRGVTKETAKSDIHYQTYAPEIVQELEAALGTKYAGFYSRNEEVVFVIKIVEGTTKEIEEAKEKATVVTKKDGINLVSEFEIVKKPLAKTEAEVKTVETELHSLIMAQQAVVRIEPKANAVVVELASNVPASDVQLANTNAAHATVVPVPPAQLEEKAATCTFKSLEAFCPNPARGGITIESSWYKEGSEEYENICTAGFHVKSKGGLGLHSLITAGHCFVTNETTKKADWYTSNHAVKLGIPFIYHVSEKAKYEFERFDAGIVGTGESEPPEGKSDVVNWGGTGADNEEYFIKENTGGVNYPGRVECKSGSATGTVCGEITNVNVPTVIKYSFGNEEILHTDKMCALTKGGDSGGPWFEDNNGFDYTLSGDSLTCKEHGASTGQELKGVLLWYEETLHDVMGNSSEPVL
jgi:hypothetical protein